MEAYCMKCKAKRPMEEAVIKTTNNRRIATGHCSKCKCKMSLFLPAEKK